MGGISHVYGHHVRGKRGSHRNSSASGWVWAVFNHLERVHDDLLERWSLFPSWQLKPLGYHRDQAGIGSMELILQLNLLNPWLEKHDNKSFSRSLNLQQFLELHPIPNAPP